MIAALYVRKSTEQNGISDDAKSVLRQIERGREYATSKGWTVREEYVFVDDGIGGAEWERRPGFMRLMNSLQPRPPFHVLIMSEESRIGREMIRASYVLQQITRAGVHVWFYLENRERTLDSPTDKFMLSATAFADEMEREKARQRTYDAMERKARAGHVTGGRVFGYDNYIVSDANGRRSHVERRINESEAAVVRRLFELRAEGHGLKAIAKILNSERRPTPRAQRARPLGWVDSSVREALHRSLYRGVIQWNRTRKRGTDGQVNPQPRPEADYIDSPAPELRSSRMSYGRRRIVR